MSDWLKKQNAFFWIGVIGILLTAIIHAVIYYFTSTHITARFNFYLVWLLFLVLNFIKK